MISFWMLFGISCSLYSVWWTCSVSTSFKVSFFSLLVFELGVSSSSLFSVSLSVSFELSTSSLVLVWSSFSVPSVWLSLLLARLSSVFNSSIKTGDFFFAGVKSFVMRSRPNWMRKNLNDYKKNTKSLFLFQAN